jgi:nitrite reductase/ring-hydroxylating ferredoxin subunit
MAEAARLICASTDLTDGGKGVRFEVPTKAGLQSAFVIRHGGRVFGYFNRCAHVGIELDWQAGEFFDDSGLYLVCTTHGATYLPDSGKCISGPCRGARLQQLDVFEQNGGIYLK